MTGVILARTLGPTDRGNLAAVLLWPGFLLVVLYPGLGEAATVFMARPELSLNVVYGTVLVITSIVSLVILASGLLLLPVVLGNRESSTLAASQLYLLAMPLGAFTYGSMGILNGLGRFTEYQLLRLIVSVVSAGGIVIVWILGKLSVETGVLPYIAANLVTAFLVAEIMRRSMLERIKFDSKLAKAMLSFGLRAHIGTVASNLNMRLDQLAMTLVVSPASLGLYVVAVTFSAGPALIGTAVQPVALPTIARASSDTVRIRDARRLIVLTLCLSIAVALGMFLIAPFLIERFFGSDFQNASTSARILIIAAIPLSTKTVLSAVLFGLNQPAKSSVAEFISLVATVVGLGALLPVLGIDGAAVASLIAYSLSLVYMLRQLTKVLDVSIRSLIVPAAE